TVVGQIALGTNFDKLYYQKLSKGNDLGLHVDIAQDRPYGSSIPELALWVNHSGSARWLLKDTGSRDREEISDAITRVEMSTSDPNVANKTIINPVFIEEFAEVKINDFGILAFPPGLQSDAPNPRTPA